MLSPYEEEGAAAGIYYIREYGEYCAEPFEKRAVFLESGQPLGKGRQYYLPRGTKIYVGSRENSFTRYNDGILTLQIQNKTVRRIPL